MNNKQLALLLTLLTASALLYHSTSTSKPSQFDAWKVKHAIRYPTQFQNTFRQKIFFQSLASIQAHNSKQDKPYEMGLNQFSALTQQEFTETYLTLQAPSGFTVSQVQEDYELLGDINWNDHGAVTPVKNQGQCGSCWAFSTTGAMQGLYKLVHGELLSFSEAQLVDCSNGYGNQGCKGGLQQNAFEYIQQNGITTDDIYPYVPQQNSCKQNKGPYTISNYIVLSTCNYLSNTISARPVAVSVDATNWSPYKSGVFNNCKTSINHAVTLVGVKGGNWIVKNSWGTSWGDKGYITLASGNTCAICNEGSYPLR